MMRSVMESSGLVFWPVFSLLLFSLFTLALGLWLYRRGSSGYYDRMAGMALAEKERAVDEILEGRR